MERDCYRCGTRIDDSAVFCPACNAPQIRVSNPSEANTGFPSGEEPRGPADGHKSSPPPVQGIQWGLFFRNALLVSAISGVLAFLIFPIGLLIVFPVSLGSTMARYRPYHPGPISRGQGARMGALMALLSFTSFLVFFLATLPWNREIVIGKIHELTAQNPDPQAQAVMLWFATPAGFVAFTILTLMFFLTMFLIVGMASGALISRSSKMRT